jgi:hypothetical protein
MKLRDLIIDHLSETAIFELAFRRRIAVDKARNLQNQIARHLIKLQMYADSEHRNHWCAELNGWLNDVQDNELKHTGSPLDKATLFNILFHEPLGTIKDVQSKMNKIYPEYQNVPLTQPDAAMVHKNLYGVLSAICVDISNSKFYDIKDY